MHHRTAIARGNLDEDEALDERESDPQALQAVCERAGI